MAQVARDYLIRLSKSGFARSVAVLSSGTAVAQIIPIVISPVLTRLYSAEDFGLVAVYMALASVMAIAATGRYEMAIGLPEREEAGASLFLVALKLCTIFVILVYVPIYLFSSEISSALGYPAMGQWLYMLPLSIATVGIFTVLQFWCNRSGEFRAMSINQIGLSGLMGLMSVTFGFLGTAAGLLLGGILGQVLATLWAWKKVWARHGGLFKSVPATSQMHWAKQYRLHPFHVAPAHLIGAAAQQLPLIMMGAAFSATVAGYFSLAYRVISLPAGVVANSIGEVFRQKAAYEYVRHGSIKRLFLYVVLATAILSLLPFLLIFFFLPDIFAIAFGIQWLEAARYGQILIVPAYFQFVITPIDKVFLIYQKTRYEFAIQILRAALLVGLFLIAMLADIGVERLLILFAAAMVAVYALVLFLAGRLVFMSSA